MYSAVPLYTALHIFVYIKCIPHQVVGEYAPAFAGYAQQDSQELMIFLLDGLHEDLNRVRRKPYVEAVESQGRPDAVVAEDSWRRNLLRNDSVLVDRCHGLLRSHVTCPSCRYVLGNSFLQVVALLHA
jgi:ubiquitin C-terminal hydrolase